MAAVHGKSSKCAGNIALIHYENSPPSKRPKMQMNPVFRLDTSRLKKLVECTHFVDKTLFIKAFFDTSGIILVTAPSRIGKSSNMDMLKTFLEIVVDENGNAINNTKKKSGQFVEKADHQLTANYKIFKENHLKIYIEQNDFFKEHCGRHPVIYMNFKAAVGPTFKIMLAQFNEIIYYVFSDHQYILQSKRLNQEDKALFAYLLNKLRYGKLKEAQLQGALKKLSQFLYIHFEKKKEAVMLIDEYDSPIGQALFMEETSDAQTINFIATLMSNLLKDNSFVDRGLINACVRLARVLSGHANNIVHLQYLGDHELSEFYGFNKKEVKSLLKSVGMLERYSEAKYWCDGYVVFNKNIKLYNGWSIINFMREKVARKFWIETVDMACLQNVFSLEPIRDRIFEMLQDHTELINTPLSSKVTNNTVDLFLQFMSDCGYFNVSDTNSQRWLSLPNKEIGEELAQKLYTLPFFIKNHKFIGDRISAFTQALKNLQPDNKHSFRNLAKSVGKLFFEIPYPSNERNFVRL